MKNDWFSQEELGVGNPDIFIESHSIGTICEISGRPLEERRAIARLLTKAPALELLPDLLAACDSAVANYDWVISDHPDLDPDGDLPAELGVLTRALAAVRQALGDVPDIFEEV